MKLDIIGDIHGHCDTLERLLTKLGYSAQSGDWKHADRKALFLGDYIDRGPNVRETLQLVRGMVESGHAFALMGNHELNAVAYHSRDAAGNPLREHSVKNTGQHRATLDAFFGREAEWADWVEWLKGLSFYLDLPGLRAVHACWCERSIGLVRGASLRDGEFLLAATQLGTDECRALDTLLKGPEYSVAHLGLRIRGRDGIVREDLRVRWWGRDSESFTLSEITMPPGSQVSDDRITSADLDEAPNLALGGAPVFFGHYKLPHDHPVGPLAEGICCLDYGVGHGGALVAYRWDGEHALEPSKFVSEQE